MPFNFHNTLKEYNLTLDRITPEILQVNVGKLCNQACLHCHVEAGPKKKEVIKSDTVDRIIEVLANSPNIKTVDITGGAPEIVPDFRRLASESVKLGKHVIDRCNLTIFFEKGHEDLPQFLKEHSIEVIASLPCYSRDNVDKQRGTGAFDKSIEGLLILNELGYGKDDPKLPLHLVYNPLGPSLPPAENQLEETYKKNLQEDFGIFFNRLFTITNVPIKRFLHQIKREGKEEEYMELLVSSFNPHAAEKVMCRNLISIGWEGGLFDCDFNQMLNLPIGGKKVTIWDIDSFDNFNSGKITFDSHCYACTAGAGSSCSGSLLE